MNILSWIVYIPLQILSLPLAIAGAALVAYKQIVVSKRLGLSQTAIEIINGRWTMVVFGLRDDQPTLKLAATLPNTSLPGLWMCLFPLWVKYKISGNQSFYPRLPEPGTETLGELVTARTVYFDRVIDRVIRDVEQFVIMGAGYDTRAYGNLRRQGISLFELDQKTIQQHKRKCLEKAGIPTDQVNFVSTRFGSEDIFAKLAAAGFDPDKKTLFLWEGVTLYLSEADIRKTLRDIRSHAVAGSVLLADFYAERFIAFAAKGTQKKTLEQTGEGLVFGLDFASNHDANLAEFVQSESLSIGETFFLGSMNSKGPFAAIVEMTVQ